MDGMSRLVAEMMRISDGWGSVPPTRMISWILQHPQQLLELQGMSPPRPKTVPPLALRKSPFSLPHGAGEGPHHIAEELRLQQEGDIMGMHTGTKGFPERALRSWMCRAIRSLPTPDSP